MTERPGTIRDKWDDRHYVDPLDPTNVYIGVSAILNAKYKPYLERARLKAMAEYAARHRKRLGTVSRAPDVVAELRDERLTLPEWERKRNEGTEAHEEIDRLVRGLAPRTHDPVTGDRLPATHPAVWGARHWADFLEDTGFTVLGSEETVISDRHGYGGSLDFRGYMPDGTTVTADTKSNQGGPRPDVGLQLEFYDHADWILDVETGARTPWQRTEEHWVFWVRPDGWAWVPIKSGPEVWRECYSRLLTYRDDLADEMIGEPTHGTLQLPGRQWGR